MSKAKAAITRAREVNADKYSPEELKAAEEKLYQSHKLLKEDKIAEARENVAESNINSEKAIEKSLPPLSKDTMEEAKKACEKADLVYSEKYAPDDFAATEKTAREAEELYNKKGYCESVQKSRETIRTADAAKEKSFTRSGELTAEVDRMNGTVTADGTIKIQNSGLFCT